MTIFRVCKDKDNPYLMLNKHCLQDASLSWKAKGILVYLLSLPDDWQIYENEIQTHATDGKDSLATGIKELIAAGYIERKRIRNKKGQLKEFEYRVYEIPSRTGFSRTGFSNAGESATTNNNYTEYLLTNNKDIYIPLKRADICQENLYVIFYNECFERYMKREHPKVTQEQIDYIEVCINQLKNKDIDFNNWQEAVNEHFKKLPKKNNGNILAFLKASFRYFEVNLDIA
jgi:hypothetical protein